MQNWQCRVILHSASRRGVFEAPGVIRWPDTPHPETLVSGHFRLDLKLTDTGVWLFKFTLKWSGMLKLQESSNSQNVSSPSGEGEACSQLDLQASAKKNLKTPLTRNSANLSVGGRTHNTGLRPVVRVGSTLLCSQRRVRVQMHVSHRQRV